MRASPLFWLLRLAGAWRLLIVFCALICFAQQPAQPVTPDGIVRAAVDAIDANYLMAHNNPLWNAAKDALLTGKYKDSAQAFQAIQKQLPSLQDSELNLLTADEIASMQSEITGEKMGLGLCDPCIDMQTQTRRARVVTPLAGSPAMKAGLQPGDVIVSINGKATSEMSHEQVIDALRSAGSGGITLRIERSKKTITVILQPVSTKIEALQSAVKRASGKTIGYIRITLFTPDLPQKAREAVTRLEQSGVEGYILDLRNDPGGFLNSGREVAGLFITGTLGYKVRSNSEKETIEAKGTPLTNKPLAVLVNAGTASASELLSGAFQGLHRAVLVGERSYGRGQAQIFMPLAEGYGIQIPVARLLTPSGQGFKGTGIVPDVEVKQPQLPENQLTRPSDKQFLRAVQSLSTDRH